MKTKGREENKLPGLAPSEELKKIYPGVIRPETWDTLRRRNEGKNQSPCPKEISDSIGFVSISRVIKERMEFAADFVDVVPGVQMLPTPKKQLGKG